MKKDFKALVAEIKRQAGPYTGDAPPITGDGAPAPSGPSQPVGGGGPMGDQQQVVGPIKEMQKAMQEFASTVVLYSTQRAPGQPPNETNVDQNKKHFNDFIAEQYLANSDIKGQEYSPDATRVTQQSKQPTDITEMNIVLNSLKRIGSQYSELNADNYWDFRTNNALKNIYAFAYGLVNLAKDFGRTNIRSFNEQDLEKMAQLIPTVKDPKDLPPKEKIDRAKQLTPLIEKLTDFYQYYVKNIATNPAWTRYIAGNDPMMTIQKGGGDPTSLDEADKLLMQRANELIIGNTPGPTENVPLQLPNTTGGKTTIPLSFLQDINSFRKLMQYTGIAQNATNDPRVQKSFLDAIMKHIDAVLGSAPTGQQTAQQTPTSESGNQIKTPF